ncbi:MAG: hypothetical protein ACXWLM_07315 [Myxococcales bacterium]
MTPARLAAAIAALAAVGFCREAYFHFLAEPRAEQWRRSIDVKYEALREALPDEGEAGYVSDDPIEGETGKRRFLETQYALAPLVLRYGDDRSGVVVVNVFDPSRLGELLGARRLELVERIGVGTAVARPK